MRLVSVFILFYFIRMGIIPTWWVGGIKRMMDAECMTKRGIGEKEEKEKETRWENRGTGWKFDHLRLEWRGIIPVLDPRKARIWEWEMRGQIWSFFSFFSYLSARCLGMIRERCCSSLNYWEG